jgi:menaquinone-9 beta-reductase
MTGRARQPGRVSRGSRPAPQEAAPLWDAVVVGAGPSGSAAAITLARRGARTLLIDQSTFPRRKVCGCCLNPGAEAALAHLGLSGLARRLGAASLHTLDVASSRARARIPLAGGSSLSREVLDDHLVRAAVQAGAGFRGGVAALSTESAGEYRRVTVRADFRISVLHARLVVLACGLAAPLAPELRLRCARDSLIGLGAVLPEQHDAAVAALAPAGVISMTLTPHGYVGGVVVEDGRLNIAAAVRPAYLRQHRTPGLALAAMMSTAGRPIPAGLGEVRFTGTPYLRRRLERVSARNLLVLGDAAGYVEPFTGEGIAWALRSGIEGGAMAADILGGRATHDAWQEHFKRRMVPRHRRCALLSSLLRSGPLTGAALRVCNAAPGLASGVASLFAAPSTG